MYQKQTFQGLAPLAFVTGALFLISQSALAGESDQSAGDGSRFGVGLGAALNRKPYQGFDSKVIALPLITYENSWIRVAGPGVEAKLGRAGDFSFGLKGFWGIKEGYKSSDADILSGMNDRKNGIWVGPSLAWKGPFATVAAEVLADVSGHSQGQQARLSIAKQFRNGQFAFGPQFGVQWLSDKYVDYYYGVMDTEANAWRVGYRGKATVNADAVFQVNYSLMHQQLLNIDLGIRHYGSGITDSPLVDKKAIPIVRLGYLYMF